MESQEILKFQVQSKNDENSNPTFKNEQAKESWFQDVPVKDAEKSP